ncbi:TBC1 domain family member 30-like isoform X1 [Asterias amurensis]|uniref:TBC1 domain family member 30-like isoform X1 n=1 Tax=Asterias amurensis TaxID=7602 RepID=UPI003AB73BD8
MAERRTVPSAAVPQDEYLELDDDIFLPYQEKVRPTLVDDPGHSTGSAEWVELPLESDPIPQQSGRHIESTLTKLLKLNNIRLGHGHDVQNDEHITESQGLDGSDSEPGIHGGASGSSGVIGNRVRVSTLSLDSRDSDNNSDSPTSPTKGETSSLLRRDSSILDGLLCEIYDRCQLNSRYSVDSDGLTEYSSNSEGAYLSSKGDSFQESTRLPKAQINTKSNSELRDMVRDLQHSVAVLSGRLIKQLKRRDRYIAKLNKNQDVLTAVLQAVSQKRRVDARLKFSIEPLPGKRAFRQWYDALRAVARLPKGLPHEFRKSVWLSLANRHIKHLKLDWPKTVRFTFNDRSNPDDDTLGVQIVKDLHRTGCSGFCGQDAEDDRVVLKRVLLAYARWNKAVGYCQGFNVLAAFILEVMERVEDDALKVMIFLIDHVLPDSYFANNLRALSVDMAVFRELLRFKLPELAHHLDKLQKTANDGMSGSYEPPLTNVFTMQWFLTLFATCLPKSLVLRVWDSIFLEGSEILLRVALAIWAKLGDRLIEIDSADEFYSTMGQLCNQMLKGNIIEGDELIQTIYSMAPFPFPHLNEIREKYMFSITPFSPLGPLPEKSEGGGGAGGGSKRRGGKKEGGKSDEEADMDEDEMMVTCFTSLFPMPTSPAKGRLEAGDKFEQSSASPSDITRASPGAYGASSSEDSSGQRLSTSILERMNMDIYALKKQYWRIQRRQQKAHVIYGSGNKEDDRGRRHKEPKRSFSTSLDSPSAINHLLIGKHGLGKKNRKSSVGTVFKNSDRDTPTTRSRAVSQEDVHSARESNGDGEESKMESLETRCLSGNERDSEDDDIEDIDTEESNVEPPVGLLIDFGSPKHACSTKHTENHTEVESPQNSAQNSSQNPSQNPTQNPAQNLAQNPTQNPAEVKTPKQDGSNKLKDNLPGDHQKGVSGTECRQGTSDLQTPSATKTKETVSPLVQERKFNFAVEAYRPGFAQHAVEGAGNPKMYGQSNAYRPWLSTDYPNSDSDDENDDDNRYECQSNGGATPSKSSQSAYNPFPTRRLKSEKDRTRSRLKVGLYKTAEKNTGGSTSNNRCINQQLGTGSRSVKSGGRF